MKTTDLSVPARIVTSMRLRYQFRIYPTFPQRVMLARTFGCVRTVWNDALRSFEEAYKAGEPTPEFGSVTKAVTTLAKRTKERAWLAEVSAVPLQQTLRDLQAARKAFFDSLAGRRVGPRVGRPRFKRKAGRQSARFTRQAFILRPNGRLYLAKIGEVRVAWSRELPAEPSSVTVIRRPDGRYFVSFVVVAEGGSSFPDAAEEFETGIDLGLTAFAVVRGGRVIDNPKFFRRAERKLRKAQRELSRKQKGSSNRAKARVKVAKVHARVADQRREFIEQVSTRIVRKNHAVCAEDLNVKGMARRKGHLGKSVHDAALGMFLRVLESKSARAGRTFVKVGRDFPSTQLCSACGARTGPRGREDLKVRQWRCRTCGVCHDRDVNAEINIRREGQRLAALAEGRT